MATFTVSTLIAGFSTVSSIFFSIEAAGAIFMAFLNGFFAGATCICFTDSPSSTSVF
jgi:hypothetical protein